MPRLLALHEYRKGHDGEPDFAFMTKAIVVGHRGGSEIQIVHDDQHRTDHVTVTLTSSTGATPHDLNLDLKAARSLRDYLVRFCDQMADARGGK